MTVPALDALRSLAYAIGFYFGSVPMVIVAFLAMPFGQRPVIAITRAWGFFHHACARWLMGTRIRLEGTIPDGPMIVAIKHEATLETFEILCLFPKPAVVFKAELLNIPLWGRAARAHGVIPVARDAGATALRQMLSAARAAVAAGRPVVIFPEGTRVRHGEMPPLRPGLAGLYKSLGLPILPIAVDSGRTWGWKSLWNRSGTVTFRVGQKIPAGLPRDEVESRVHAAINALNLR